MSFAKRARQLRRAKERLSHTARHYSIAAVTGAIDEYSRERIRSLGREALAQLRRAQDELRSIERLQESDE